jgi:hypothetical protein
VRIHEKTNAGCGVLMDDLGLTAEAFSRCRDRDLAKASSPLFPLRSLGWNDLALVEETKQPLVYQIGRCLERTCQASRRTRLPPVLSDDAPAFSAPKNRSQRTIERIPPVEFADQP